MKTLLAFAGFLLTLCRPLGASDSLREAFLHPPDEAKPRGYWLWPNGNFDYSTIRRELAEFKGMGLGGVDIFDLGVQDRNKVVPPGPGFLSVEQVDGIAFALGEAKRLGLKLGLIVSSSWNAGGTWTPPELAMMNLVAWQETVMGPLHYERVLPFPAIPDTFRKPYGVFPLHVPKDADGMPLYRKEVALLACPVDAEGRITDPQQVRVLNDRLDASGKLTCDLPEGQWMLMRTVLVNFGQRLWLPSPRSQGLTMDHFSREATRHHFQTVIDRLEARVGPLADTALERLYLASYEANAGVTWTPGFTEAFQQQNGYRIESYLPALFGRVVVDEETTQRFLYDYRKTVSELFLENLYREGSRICREHGLLLCSESGGPGAPLHDVPTEDLAALGAVDVMRGEFWVDKADRLDDDGLETLQVVKQIASAAHIYGHRLVEMEAFTSHLNWQEGPDVFKHLADRAFCEGMTRVIYHTMSHNLPEAGQPGWTYHAGSHMNTHLTWWDLSAGLHAYLARCSALLMQGDFIADVAYYSGHEIPKFAKPKHIRPGLGFGYDYDDLNTEILLRASVDDAGRILLPSGMRYALLVLPEDDLRMDLAVIQKIEELLDHGATVLGPKPQRIYGLRGFPEEERRLRRIANRLWGADAPAAVAEFRHGRGRLVVGKTEREVLASLGVVPDLEVHPPAARSDIDFIHRRVGGAEIYFVRNVSEKDLDIEIRFRSKAHRPECWDAVSGAMSSPAIYHQTAHGVLLPLTLPARGSRFVVLLPDEDETPHITAVEHQGIGVFPGRSEPVPRFQAWYAGNGRLRCTAPQPGVYELTFSNGDRRTVTIAPEAESLEIAGSWEVRFPRGWGVPTRQQFDPLRSWTEDEHPATRAFSGKAVYARQFQIEPARLSEGQRVLLDLGAVREIARVYLNGHDAGTSSFSPHKLDVSGWVRAGENSLVIEVSNTWLNRLIADDSLPEQDRRSHTNLRNGPALNTRWRDAQPRPSGLLGPVHLRFPREEWVHLPNGRVR